MADPNTKGDQAMPDTKYLQKRDGCWYIRVARPPKSWGLGGKEFLHSLKTGELRHAQRLRDKHLCPILAEDSSVRMVEAIARILGTADADMNERLRQFGIQLGDDGTMSLADLADDREMLAAFKEISTLALRTEKEQLLRFGDIRPESIQFFHVFDEEDSELLNFHSHNILLLT